MGSINTETETVIKKILPYMKRRGYNIEQDFDFETAVSTTDRYTKGYVDILVTLGKKTPFFLIEAKRLGKNLTKKDRDQAILYARSKEIKVPFVVVTNGKDIQCFNTKNKQRIIWNGKRSDKVPSRSQIEKVVKTLRIKPDEVIINISNDESLPYRHGLPLRQLNALFARGHNTIHRQIVKYQNRISGPILDRIDLFVRCEEIGYEALTSNSKEESSADIRKRVSKAWEIQKERFAQSTTLFNGRMNKNEVEIYCKLDEEGQQLMKEAFSVFQLTGRSYFKILKVARTIADLEGSYDIKSRHVEEALYFRQKGEGRVKVR